MNESIGNNFEQTKSVNIDIIKRRIFALKELKENLEHEDEINKIQGNATGQPKYSLEIAQVLAMYTELLDIPNINGNWDNILRDLDTKYKAIIDKNFGGNSNGTKPNS